MNKYTPINNADKKLVHHCLNLEYCTHNQFQTFEGQTNYIIQTLMNDFINKYKNSFPTHNFVMEWNDDIISVIGYKIIKNLQGLFHFDLYVFGNRNETKEYIKKEKKITKNKLSKLSNVVYISCFNPIYNVISHNHSFNNFGDTYYLMNKFIPSQLSLIAERFYQINDKNLMRLLLNSKVSQFEDFCSCIAAPYCPETHFDNKDDFKLILFKLGKNEEVNNAVFDEIKNTNDIIFWFTDNIEKLFEYGYGSWVGNKDNAPCSNHLNIISEKTIEAKKVLISLLPYHKFSFIGNWSNINNENEINKELYDCLLSVIKNNKGDN